MCDNSIGAQIKKARKISGRTQAQLAEDCGLATGTIQQYELGKREPRIKILCRIAQVLGVDVVSIIPTEWMVFHDL